MRVSQKAIIREMDQDELTEEVRRLMSLPRPLTPEEDGLYRECLKQYRQITDEPMPVHLLAAEL